ncbi:MAG: hypothetical protein WBA17_13625 [Saprospiraceae bacterium]
MKRYSLTLALAFVGLFSLSSLNAQSIFDRLQTADADGIREITLRLPLDSILTKTTNSQTAEIEYVLDQETGPATERRPLQVDVRGKFRRRICSFPPLKLNFSKKDLAASGLVKHDKLKLVTHCSEAGGEDLLLREFLAYRLYNQLTPQSYRVQLVRVTYEDTNGGASLTQLGFLIEDTDEMAERIGGEEMENLLAVAPDRLDADASTLHSLFQFAISNTDYSLELARNLKLVQLPGGKLVPVGYDFDFSALVNAPYAVPAAELGQLAIGQRVYLGYYVDDATFLRAAQRVLDERKELVKLVRKFRPLPYEQRDELVIFLDRFYFELNTFLKRTDNNYYVQLRNRYTSNVPVAGRAVNYGVGR